MSHAPERIWAWVDDIAGVVGSLQKPETNAHVWPGPNAITHEAEYMRADLVPAAQPAPDVAALVEALRFYADEATYETIYERRSCDCCTDIFEPINEDKGAKARAAIAAWEARK